MKNSKAPGPDSVEIDIIKAADKSLEAELATLYIRCIAMQKVPTAWKESEMVLVFKKRRQERIKKLLANNSPISHLQNIYENNNQKIRTKT